MEELTMPGRGGTYYKRNGEERSEAHGDAIELLEGICGGILDRVEENLAKGKDTDLFELRTLSVLTKAYRMMSIMD